MQTGKSNAVFDVSDGKPERIGKVIGDALAALIFLMVVLLIMFR
jgi:hypothetical protein